LAPGKNLHLPELFIGARNVRGGGWTLFLFAQNFINLTAPTGGLTQKPAQRSVGGAERGQLQARGYDAVQQERDLLQGQQDCLQSQPVRARCRLSFIFVAVRYNKHSSCRPPRKHSAAWLAISGTRSDTMQILISGHVSWNAAGSKCSQTRSITGSFGRPLTRGGRKGPQPRHLRDAWMRPG
jgi:hypothetical protein